MDLPTVTCYSVRQRREVTATVYRDAGSLLDHEDGQPTARPCDQAIRTEMRDVKMTDKGSRPCRSCTRMVRRGYGDLCDSCAFAEDAPPLVPQEFFDTPDLRAALKICDFALVFRAVRSEAGLSQQALGERLHLRLRQISNIENGRSHLQRYADLLTRIANTFGIPTERLGYEANTIRALKEGKDVKPLYDRRGLFSFVHGLTFGGFAGMALDFERLEVLAPDSGDSDVPRRVGAEDVATIRKLTAVYRAADFRHGGGLARETAVALLGKVTRMREWRCTEQVRAELWLATAELASVAGRMTCDVERHEGARQLWLIGLGAAHESNHELATDMMVCLQLQMANQSIHLRNPKEALSFVRLAEMTAASGDYPVSAQTRTYMSFRQATCQAMLGKADLYQRALDQAQERAGDVDPTAALPWTAHVTPAEITALTGGAMYRLAQRERGYAPKAVEHLRTAVDTFGDEYARSRAVNLSSLAGAYVLVGDLDTAIATGHRAVTEISALSSTRVHDRLWTLAKVAQPYNHRPDVAELRQRIHQTVTTAA
jgi:transcriptional regulator with XRE-family HTH domain